MTTTHVQSFVLISMLRGQPKTPPSGDDLGVLNYHLNIEVFPPSRFLLHCIYLWIRYDMFIPVCNMFIHAE